MSAPSRGRSRLNCFAAFFTRLALLAALAKVIFRACLPRSSD